MGDLEFNRVMFLSMAPLRLEVGGDVTARDLIGPVAKALILWSLSSTASVVEDLT